MSLFYTYVWRDAAGVPFYVGKGTGRRAWHLAKRSAEFRAIHAAGGCSVEVVDEFVLESDAHAHEVHLIALYGRRIFGGSLVNKSDGGEGMAGLVHSAETKAKISAAITGERNPRFGKTVSAETRALIAAANIGKTQSVETKGKNRASQLKRFENPEERAKLSEAHLKRFENPAERERQSVVMLKRFSDPAERARVSAVSTQRYTDPAEREKHAVALRMHPVRRDNTSGFKGVSFDKTRGKWLSSLRIDRQQKNLGRYSTAVQAAIAYDAACIAAFGIGNCYLNFPPAANDNLPIEQRRSAA